MLQNEARCKELLREVTCIGVFRPIRPDRKLIFGNRNISDVVPRKTNWVDLKRILISLHIDVHRSWARHEDIRLGSNKALKGDK